MRPPVVTLLGHVDHGKTTLLSALKGEDLTREELGGISQHTRVVEVEKEIEGESRKITFVDTPGHKAFQKMRRRGGKVADLALLVIAANEGVKPQTREVISHIKERELPVLVALNKMDLAGARPEKCKKELASEGLVPEELGGKVPVVLVSAKKKTRLQELLEMLFLLAEEVEPSGSPQDPLSGVVVDSFLDPKRGPLALILVKKGLIKMGEEIFAGKEKAKVRAIFDPGGKRKKSIGPSEGGEVLGFSQIPPVGALVSKQPPKTQAPKKPPPQGFAPREENVFPIVLKADTQGTLEAVGGAIEGLEEEGRKLVILEKGVGPVTQSDVLLASSAGGEVFSFGVPFQKEVEDLAEERGVPVRSYGVIYRLIEGVGEALARGLKKEKEKDLARVLKCFTLPLSGDRVAGVRVVSGKIRVGDRIKAQRGKKRVYRGRVKSVHYRKEAVKVAEKGKEAGLLLKPNFDWEKGDVIDVV